MIRTENEKLYTATEISLCLGITRKTLGTYSKMADIPDRRIQRVRYYTEGEIQTLLRIPGRNIREEGKTPESREE